MGAAAGAAAALGLGAWWLTQASAVVQPIAFPHRAHLALEKPKLECKSCHEGVETGRAAGRPTLKKCLSCHGGGEAKGAEEQKIQVFGDRKAEIPWRRVFRLPDDVFFSHRAHVTGAAIECQRCHGDMATLDRPPARPLHAPTMGECIACHERWQWPPDAPPAVAARRVAADCAACHR
jgi:hypothetical protein